MPGRIRPTVCLERQCSNVRKNLHFNITGRITLNNLSLETVFVWPIEWSFKTGSTVTSCVIIDIGQRGNVWYPLLLPGVERLEPGQDDRLCAMITDVFKVAMEEDSDLTHTMLSENVSDLTHTTLSENVSDLTHINMSENVSDLTHTTLSESVRTAAKTNCNLRL